MIIYIKQFKTMKLIYRIFSLFKIEKEENRTIIYLPINKHTRKRRLERVTNKLSKYLYNNAIKNVVLQNELMQNEVVKNVLYSNNINILDGSKLSKFLMYNIIKKIYAYKNKNIQAGEITVLVNENNSINVENLNLLARNVKRLNIITNNTHKFSKLVEYMYNEIGIIIKLSSNKNTNLSHSDIIVNIDFPEEEINKLRIPINSIILNTPKNIKINSKKFSGINIQNWEIKIPEKFGEEDFNDVILYEASIYNKTIPSVFEQIKLDNIKVGNLIGINGVINRNEFV